MGGQYRKKSRSRVEIRLLWVLDSGLWCLAALDILLGWLGARGSWSASGLGLLALLLLLLRLGLGDGSQPCVLSHCRGLVPLCGDGSKVSTDDTTLVLYGATGAFLCDFLGETLFVHATVDYGPGDFAGVFALEEEGGGFGA